MTREQSTLRALGPAIRQRRAALGLTVSAVTGVGGIPGVDESHWRKVEASRVQPSLRMLLRMAIHLDTTASALLAAAEVLARETYVR